MSQAAGEAVSLAIVDDDHMLLGGFESWLSGVPDLRLIAAVGTIDELLAGPDGSPRSCCST